MKPSLTHYTNFSTKKIEALKCVEIDLIDFIKIYSANKSFN